MLPNPVETRELLCVPLNEPGIHTCPRKDADRRGGRHLLEHKRNCLVATRERHLLRGSVEGSIPPLHRRWVDFHDDFDLHIVSIREIHGEALERYLCEFADLTSKEG